MCSHGRLILDSVELYWFVEDVRFSLPSERNDLAL